MSVRKFSTASIRTGTKSSKFWDQTTFTSHYQSIATVTVGSPQATISFTSIPATFKHLQIRCIARSTNTVTFSNFIEATFNSDTTSGNYHSVHRVVGRGDGLVIGSSNTGVGYSRIGFVAGGGMRANTFTPSIIDILDYTSTTKNKTTRTITGSAGQSTSTDVEVDFMSSLYFPSTIAAINRIDLNVSGANFAQYSQFALYGIKGA